MDAPVTIRLSNGKDYSFAEVGLTDASLQMWEAMSAGKNLLEDPKLLRTLVGESLELGGHTPEEVADGVRRCGPSVLMRLIKDVFMGGLEAPDDATKPASAPPA